MSRIAPDGSVEFEAPVSTLHYGSLERGQYAVPLRWPGQHGMYNHPMDQLARRFYEKDRLEFFSMREILFHGKERGASMRAASLDAFFGVRFVWPYEAKKGERYVFTFKGEPPPESPGEGMTVNDLEMPDLVLVNGRIACERGFGESLVMTAEYVAAADGPMEVTLVKDRFRTVRDSHKGWQWRHAMTHANCNGFVHLHMGLNLACEHFGPTDAPPTNGKPYDLPDGMRTFRNPGPWQWVPDEDVVPFDAPPVVEPEYPTDGVLYNQFHDMYLDDPARFSLRPGLWDRPEVIRALVRMSFDNGIRCFTARPFVMDALEAEGLVDDPRVTLFYSGGYIKRIRAREDTTEAQRERRLEMGRQLADVLRRFPKSKVVYRLNEFSGCQYAHVVTLPEDRARAWPKPWYEFTKAADEINREALEELLAEARGVDASRLSVGANVQTGHLAAHPLHCGADFTIEKTIGRHQVNLVVANSRGVNGAFDRTIGLQHDAWGGLNYNRDSAREIEAIHRSFFFNGAGFHDAEFGGVAMTEDGRAAFNKKGVAWARVTRLAAIHPKRGAQRVTIGFLRGSDNLWGWFYPGTHTMGPRDFNGYDPADPKEYVDFDLLNVAFPRFGTWMSFNPERWMTGTPYGPCDLVPWDAPVEALSRYRVLCMLGANRFEDAWWHAYVEYVKRGGTLVLGLYQLLAPGRDRVYYKRDVADLFGVTLGEDVALGEFETMFDRQFFSSQHYNKVNLAGADVIERLPNGDALLTRLALGDGAAYLFTTDRLVSVPDVAERLVRSLFAPHVPVRLGPENDRIEIAVSEKGDVRIVTLMDHGRDRLPTDAGEDTGPYAGTVALDLANLGLGGGEYEVIEAVVDEKVTKMDTRPVPFTRRGEVIEVRLEGMGPYCELVIGPRGRVADEFFETAR